MSATADKARYFLEQSVPELKEFERNKIFNQDEINSIARKRSDFEHKINARGSAPSDYAQYAEFEINVETLRRKRVKRMGIKSTAHNGQRRIFFVFDRGTRKFPGDVGLWMQSIEYARRQKAYKKLLQMFTTVLRLHPTKSDLWVYAAQFAVDENGDMTEARSYMQRGLRFCKNNKHLWLEYIRLELAYMAKIQARRQVLGIGESMGEEEQQSHREDHNDDLLSLPKVTAEDLDPVAETTHDIDITTLRNLDKTPVMSGAIPQAIFDAAMDNFNFDGEFALKTFNTFADFSYISVISKLLDHVVQVLQDNASNTWQTQACYISRPMAGINYNQPGFPSALRETMRRVNDALLMTAQKSELADWYRDWLSCKAESDIDPALERVIGAHLRTLGSHREGS